MIPNADPGRGEILVRVAEILASRAEAIGADLIFTRDLAAADAFVQAALVGIVHVNGETAGASRMSRSAA